MIEVLFNVFNTRRSLIELLKAVVDQEIEKSRTSQYPFLSA